MSDEMPNLAGNYKKRQGQPETIMSKFERVVEEYKALLADKIHPKNRTNAYETNTKSILSRLLSTADELDAEKPGHGIFGLIILSLRVALSQKDIMLEQEVKIKDLENRIKRLEKQ